MSQSQEIDQALALLKAGQVIGLPTETVYGLAADATNEAAIKKIYALKDRPADHPLIVHIAPPNLEELDSTEAWSRALQAWARDIPEEALVLAKTFWPGPLTMVLTKAKQVSPLVTGGQDTVAIRCPNHPVAIDLLKRWGKGLVAPSANRFGKVSPTCAQDVLDEFPQENLLVLDGGHCQVGIESTIIDLSRLDQSGPRVLRPGMLTQEDILQALSLVAKENHDGFPVPRVSGSLSAHYAPKTPLILRNLNTVLPELSHKKVAYVSLGLDPQAFAEAGELTLLQWGLNPAKYAQQLYRVLRDFDKENYDYIIFDEPPDTQEWSGILDRLKRAAQGSGY
jgi:L-threonylcarbamoyladenylate synthase